MKTAAVLLAAGQGTRMKSKLPKVLHPLAGKPLVVHALDALAPLTTEPTVVVVGYQAETIKTAIGENARFVLQAEQLGTGHAVMQADEILRGQADLVVIAYGDMPLLTEDTFRRLIETQKENAGLVTMLSIEVDNPRGFGRVVRNDAGHVTAIVEEVDCTPEQRKITELNAGVYCFRGDWLWDALQRIELSAKGEYYLTDLVAIANQDGGAVQAIVLEDAREAIGINTRVHLSEAETLLRERINRHWLLAGVTMIDPATTYIETDVQIGADTILYPNTTLQGKTTIGADCVIGPNTLIRDSEVGNRCEILSSVIEQARLEDEVDVGPYAHLRKGAHLGEGVHIGNFGEIKNSYLAPGTKVGHFSYIGDATIGKDVNIGAGTITCNYDGEKKHHTEIGDGAFIGSDTMLVAPLVIGKGGRTGAGSVVTKNVPEDTVVVGIPARAMRKLKKKSE